MRKDKGSKGQRRFADNRRSKPRQEPIADGRDAANEDASATIAGKHAVMEALRAMRPIHKIWLADTLQRSSVQQLLALAKEAGVPTQHADKRKLDQLSEGLPHQGVLAQASAAQYVEVDDLLAAAEAKGEPPFILILDELEDPHNLGSILRSCDCTGAHGVIIPKRRSVGLTATVSRTSVGAVEFVPVARVTNLAQTIDELKQRGVWVVGTDVQADALVSELDLTMPLAIVIGNEHKGIGRLVRDRCDLLGKLPMFGRLNSLNASVAAGVIMYEVVRQRQAALSR